MLAKVNDTWSRSAQFGESTICCRGLENCLARVHENAHRGCASPTSRYQLQYMKVGTVVSAGSATLSSNCIVSKQPVEVSLVASIKACVKKKVLKLLVCHRFEIAGGVDSKLCWCLRQTINHPSGQNECQRRSKARKACKPGSGTGV